MEATLKSLVHQNHHHWQKDSAKKRKLINKCTLQQKCLYLFFTFVLSFHSTGSFQLLSASFSLLSPSYRINNVSSFYDSLFQLIQKSDSGSPELPKLPKNFLMTCFTIL